MGQLLLLPLPLLLHQQAQLVIYQTCLDLMSMVECTDLALQSTVSIMNQKLTVKTLFAHLLSLVFPMLVNTCVEALNQNAQDSEHEQKNERTFLFIYSKLDFVLKCMLYISVKRKINEQPLPI